MSLRNILKLFERILGYGASDAIKISFRNVPKRSERISRVWRSETLLFYVWHVEIGTKGVGAWAKPLKFSSGLTWLLLIPAQFPGARFAS